MMQGVFSASSSRMYSDTEVFPTPEPYEGRVDPLGPRSCYEEGKRFREGPCKAYGDEYGGTALWGIHAWWLEISRIPRGVEE